MSAMSDERLVAIKHDALDDPPAAGCDSQTVLDLLAEIKRLRAELDAERSAHAKTTDNFEVFAGIEDTETDSGIACEVLAERARQDAKWGPPGDMPSLDPDLLGLKSPEAFTYGYYSMPTEEHAKLRCDNARAAGICTLAHVLVEEVAEVIGCMGDESAMREELVQVAAVAFKWIHTLDKRAAGGFL